MFGGLLRVEPEGPDEAEGSKPWHPIETSFDLVRLGRGAFQADTGQQRQRRALLLETSARGNAALSVV